MDRDQLTLEVCASGLILNYKVIRPIVLILWGISDQVGQYIVLTKSVCIHTPPANNSESVIMNDYNHYPSPDPSPKPEPTPEP